MIRKLIEFSKRSTLLRQIAREAYPVYVFLLKSCFVLVSVVEVPIFLMRRRSLFQNDIVTVFWIWSFGHTISGLDFMARLYFPHRISLIYLPHRCSNEFLPRCFANMDLFVYRSALLPDSPTYDGAKQKVLSIYLHLLSGITTKFDLVDFFNVYKTVSLAGQPLLQGSTGGRYSESMIDWTGYVRLIRDSIGERPRLPTDLQKACQDAVRRAFPEFERKPYVALLLRDIGKDDPWETRYRSAGPQENYVEMVRYLASEGYHIVGTGETDHRVFRGIPGYFSLDSLALPAPLINLFILMNASLFIGQQSGPYALSNSCGIPCLITDAVPYRSGTCCRDDLILFKHMREIRTDRRISIVEVFKKHQDLAYGYNFETKGVDVVPNSSEELLEGAKETVALIRGRATYSNEELLLIEAFRALPPKEMTIHHLGNRPSLHLLRQVASELFEAAGMTADKTR